MILKIMKIDKIKDIKVGIDRSTEHCIDVKFDTFNYISLTKEEADELQTKLSQALQEVSL